MSELTNTRGGSRNFRGCLLTTVSALTLLAAVYGANQADAADQDTDHPIIWIELGGQLERLGDTQETFDPSFMASITKPALLSALNVQKPPSYAIDEDAKISFQPDDSDWVFSASVRYGRSHSVRHEHQQTPNAKFPVNVKFPTYFTAIFTQFKGKYIARGTYYPSFHAKFADGQTQQSESHIVLDFQAGKDVGLGMFGRRGSSIISGGLRIAQFSSRSSVALRALPDLQYPSAPITNNPALLAFKYAPIHFHAFSAFANSQRSFRGMGPSIAWNASMPFAGNSQQGELTFDWGANGAVLIGRQSAQGHHQSTVRTYYDNKWERNTVNGLGAQDPGLKPGRFFNPTLKAQAGTQGYYTRGAIAQHTNAPPGFARERSVIVPNLGGFAGLSFIYSDAKISFGYRADFFFGAVDGGIDTRKSENRNFYGPFASISVGIGG